MKPFLPFLLSALLMPLLCLAQNNFVKTTAFRITNPNRVGHTTLLGFIKEYPYLGDRIQAVQSNDESVALALLNLKKRAKSWEKKALPIESQNYAALLRVPNMYVVQINRLRDTIYTTHNNASIFFPEEETEYLDPGNYINGLLDEDLCYFAERNFQAEFATYQRDSIPALSVCLNYEAPYGLSRKGFEKNVMPFHRVSTDSVFGKKKVTIEKKFWINNYRMKFEEGKISNLDAYYVSGANYLVNVPLTIGGIQLNDSEEKLAEVFPCSLEYPNWGTSVYDIGNTYYYMIRLEKELGFVTFYIKDKRIEHIEAEFR